MKKPKITFIDNDQTLGIAYDWNKILKLYKSLDIPPEYDYSEMFPLANNNIKWYIANSGRSVGKTTNVMLIGMCMNILYGTQIQLVRHKICKASYYENLFDTINSYGYVSKLTEGKYNTVYYHWKKFYYGRIENGKIVDKCEEPFCVSLAAEDCYSLCSTYEAPLGDWIVLDKCFNDKNTPDEFVRFLHLHKTIVRERISDKIIVLGNTLDVNNVWYRQLTIQSEVRKLKPGDSKVVYTPEGMPLHISFIDNRTPTKRKTFNKLHYGFKNPEINAIVGSGEWNMKQYPQTCMLKNRELLGRGIYFNYHDDLFLEAGMLKCDSGIYFEVHPATYSSAINGDILYTISLATRLNELYFGEDSLSKRILKAIKEKRVVFSDNETGHLFESFLRERGL